MSRKRSKIERIVRGVTFERAKYAGLVGIAMSLGCVPVPNLFSVSPDGRYVAVSVSQEGDIAVEDALVAVIDVKEEKVKVIDGLYKYAYWFDNSKDVVVFESFLPREDGKGDVVLIKGGRTERIRNAVYPSLSQDGRFLLYSHLSKKDGKENVRLHLRDLENGTDRDLEIQGIFGSLSPDLKHVAYLDFGSIEDERLISLKISDLEGNRTENICRLRVTDWPIYSFKWISDNEIVFQGVTEFSGADSELFSATIYGEVEQFTNNFVGDGFPCAVGDGFLFVKNLESLHEDNCSEIFKLIKTDYGWIETPVGVRAFSLESGGDRLFFMRYEKKGFRGDGQIDFSRLSLYMSNSNFHFRKNLSALLRREVPEYVARHPTATMPADELYLEMNEPTTQIGDER